MTDNSASPAVGTSLLINLGGDRQLTLQCFFPGDVADDVGDKLIDKLLRHGDRAKARYDLEALTEQFNLVGLQLQGMIDGTPIAEHNYRDSQASLDKQIGDLEAKKSNLIDTGFSEFRNRGGAGEYKPKGANASAINRIVEQIAQCKVKKEENDRERDGWRQTFAQTVKHHQQDLAKRRAKMDSLRKLVAMEPNTDFLDTEQFEPPTE